MGIEENRDRALDFLYDRYVQSGGKGTIYVDWDAAQAATGRRREDLGRAFRGLVQARLAEGIPGGGTNLRPEDGAVAISAEGRREVERRRAAREPAIPPTIRVLFAGFTAEGARQYAELLARVGAEERERFLQLLAEVADEDRPEADRLERAETLVNLVRGSSALVGSLLGAVAPHAAPVLQRPLGEGSGAEGVDRGDPQGIG